MLWTRDCGPETVDQRLWTERCVPWTVCCMLCVGGCVLCVVGCVLCVVGCVLYALDLRVLWIVDCGLRARNLRLVSRETIAR